LFKDAECFMSFHKRFFQQGSDVVVKQ